MVVNLLLNLDAVGSFDVGTRSEYFEYDLLAVLVPVLGQVNLGVGSLVDFLLYLVSLVNHHRLALRGVGAQGRGLLTVGHHSLAVGAFETLGGSRCESHRLTYFLAFVVSHFLGEDLHLVDGG